MTPESTNTPRRDSDTVHGLVRCFCGRTPFYRMTPYGWIVACLEGCDHTAAYEDFRVAKINWNYRRKLLEGRPCVLTQ